MDKLKNFILKYKVGVTIILLVIASFGIYFFANADEDIYNNQVEVVNAKVNEIIDGTANQNELFDENDEPGNDSSPSNKIVRNFDEIVYNVSYGLEYKQTAEFEEEPSRGTRKVMVDVLVPASVGGNVVIGRSSTPQGAARQEVTIDSILYSYYEFEIEEAEFNDKEVVIPDEEEIPEDVIEQQDLSEDEEIAIEEETPEQVDINKNKLDIVLSDINTKNGEQIKPIIRIREASDEEPVKIEEGVTLEQIQSLEVENVTVSAAPKYGIKLFNGTVQKGNKDGSGISTFPLGIVVYLPRDDIKDMKGIEVPTEAEFDLSISSSSVNSSLVYDVEDKNNINNPSISNYDSTKYSVLNLPKSYETDNGNAGYENISLNENNTSTFKIKFQNLKYHTDVMDISNNEEVKQNPYYLSSKVFVFKAERNGESILKKENIDYTISINNNNFVTMQDTYVPFPGDYISKIDFISSANITTNSNQTYPTFDKPGYAMYNYNEEFYIQNTISYGYNMGDSLENGLTNYIKVDNTAFRIIDVGNLSDETLDYYVEIKSVNENQNTSSDAYSVQYGVGEWVYTNFNIKPNAPSYCPTNLRNLTKEKLMNYYGGPCIEENNNIKWYNSIEEAAEADENNRNKIILFKFDFEDEFNTETEAIIRLKAKVVNNINNVGKTFQITSRGVTTWDYGNGDEIYYLSEVTRSSVADHSRDLEYIKTEYDANFNPIAGTNIPVIYGNTVFVTPFKAFFNETIVKDKYDSVKNTIYLGATDPMEIIINPVIYKSDPNATISNATVSVYLPSNLEIYIKKGDKSYSNARQQVIDNILYNVYDYTYTEDDIKYDNESAAGTIKTLVIHAYITIDTKDNTEAKIMSTIDATLKPNINAVTTFNAKTSIDKRTTTKSIILKNNQEISSIGKIDRTYIDKNESFNYVMKAANLTGNDAEFEILKILPYKGDDISGGSDFDGTLTTAIVGTLPTGYEAYYTTDDSKKIYSNEIKKTDENKWIKWTNYNTHVKATAILIKSNSKIKDASFFAGSNGITLNIKTKNNKESDIYYTNFYILNKTNSSVYSSSSNTTSVSVYNRKIKGYVFEDNNYDGFYSNDEANLKDIIVELYQITNSNYSEVDSKNPLKFINDSNSTIELKEESITNKKGSYSFNGLSSGNYFVKYKFNCDKYTVTEKNKQDPTIQGDASLKDSDAVIVEYVTEDEKNVCYAVSNIITLNKQVVEARNIDLGLRIRQNFDINIKKYITNVTVTSNKGTKSYDYNNATRVKIDEKNLKNTSIRVTYGFEIENSKYFPGTIGNIIETIPEGMTFDPTLPGNDGWIKSDGNLYYTNFNKTLILPGEKYHMTIVLDLKTDSGGQYINYVVANNLTIMSPTTNFLETIEVDRSEEVEEPEEETTEDEEEEE